MTRRHLRGLIVAGATAALVGGVFTAPAAAAEPPTCYGETATIVGTSFGESLVGTSGRDVIAGLGGNDRIDGQGGNDVICGDDGNDALMGGDGTDSIDGGAGRDDIRLGPNEPAFERDPDTNEEIEVFDRADGGAGQDTIDGGSGRDRIFGDEGDDRIDGGSGDDLLGGDDDADTIRGGDGDDTMSGDAGSDIAYGESGSDRWDGQWGESGDVDHFCGGPGEDFAVGGDEGRQVIHGDDGDDDLGGGGQADTLVGGSGDDLLAGYGDDDILQGDAGSDTVDYSRDNYFEGVLFSDNELPVQIDLERQTASGVGRDRLSSIENAIGGAGRDQILGSAGPNTFTFAGHNVADDDGVAVGDVIDGRGGSDTLVATDDPCCGGLRVDLQTGRARFADEKQYATITSIENAVGTWRRDVLLGDDQANVLRGLEGRTRSRAEATTTGYPAAPPPTSSEAEKVTTRSTAAEGLTVMTVGQGATPA